MLEILDAVIATAAVVLGLSLIVQAIQQIFKQVFDLKSSYMRAELLALFLDDREAKKSFKRSFLNNFFPYRFIARNADPTAKRIVEELEQRMSTFGIKDLHLIEDFDAGKLKAIVSSMPIALDENPTIKAKFEDALRQIDLWLDICKKAFQEHYERRMKLWAFMLSAIVVVALNANVFDIYKEFSSNKPVRETAIAMGKRFVSTPRDSLLMPATTTRKDTTVVALYDSTTIKNQLDIIQSIVDEKSFQLMGWTQVKIDKYRKELGGPKPWYRTIAPILLGWFGMTLLVSLGAPFWYDFLKTVMGVKDKLKGASKPATANNSHDIPPAG